MGHGTTVNIDGLAKAVMDRLKDYKGVCSETVEKAVDKTAKETVSEIKEAARNKFGGTGEYVRSWKSKKQKTKSGTYSTIVYSDTGDNQASWLENGHARVGGGRVEGRPHIAPAAENAAEMLERLIKEGIERG